jgi:hypothetical protein
MLLPSSPTFFTFQRYMMPPSSTIFFNFQRFVLPPSSLNPEDGDSMDL